jgi:hypothetical protein
MDDLSELHEHSDVDIHREDDGLICVTFGAGTEVGEIRGALESLPGDSAVNDVVVSWFCGADDCEGIEVPDEEHEFPVLTLIMEPAWISEEKV